MLSPQIRVLLKKQVIVIPKQPCYTLLTAPERNMLQRKDIMKTIGDKIKEYRKKSEMTQEQLAARLNVTFQTVSKWETNTSSPDLSMIIPLTRLFGVTADELLGLNDSEPDERYAELMSEYKHTYMTDDFAKRQSICETAVSEYPGDMKWLSNLAWVISNRSFEYDNHEKYVAEQEKAIKLFDSIIKNCKDDIIRGNAIQGITQLLGWRDRREEAKKYAEMLPERGMITRENIMENILDGDELILFRQKRIMSHVEGILWELSLMPDIFTDVMRKIVGVMFPDGNLLEFNLNLYFAVKREINRLLEQNPAADVQTVLNLLSEMKRYAQAYDSAVFSKPGIYRYTAPWFDRIEDDTREWLGNEGSTVMKDLSDFMNQPQFNAFRDCDIFQTLLS